MARNKIIDTILLAACVFLSQVLCDQEDNPIVSISNGKVKGVREKSYSAREYFGFHSVPYAKPPVGELRFNVSTNYCILKQYFNIAHLILLKFPEPVENWDYIKDTTKDGPACLQIKTSGDEVFGEEDCLWLSVFTPELPSVQRETRLKPVLVWIHGGRYAAGTARVSLYSPTYMMDYGDIVVVSIQYRMGALGFLSTEDVIAPGNYGLHDQVLALKWIQENIARFGGDPNQVTIDGHSAGAAAAHGHLVSKQNEGLFHKIIAMSGTSHMAWNSRYTIHKQVAKQQADLVGCPSSSSEELIKCLRTVDAKTLTAAQSDLHSLFLRTNGKLPLTTYMPRTDLESSNPFFHKVPREAMREGDFNKDIPLITGLTTQEGAWYVVSLLHEKGREDFHSLKYDIMHYMSGPDMLSLEVSLNCNIHCYNLGSLF